LHAGGALDAITNLCKRRGFIFPGSEIYGSIGTAYDFGPLGCQLKKNLMDRWWRDFVERRRDCVGIETAIILNPKGTYLPLVCGVSSAASCSHEGVCVRVCAVVASLCRLTLSPALGVSLLAHVCSVGCVGPHQQLH
jgi:hypothetical protein